MIHGVFTMPDARWQRIAITGGAADTDTTAVAAGQVKVMLSRTV